MACCEYFSVITSYSIHYTKLYETTLLNAIGGLDSLDSGEISIDGERVDRLGKAALADLRLYHIGFVFQAYNLIPVLSARENVEFVMQVQGVGVSYNFV